ncbi:ABC transporter ATP-binding protein [Oscillospiraceae bacterium CLA-AA-H272]|jgi:iron complex transport system ATP-binding protein|uniref:ABC transporter ATP-binding protein n=1 Tax=Brotocaccenecus cirricatena TaxID=3064195 RepID=A0AAE3DEZ9_9FIRM|nr:ABC transporter ATP-binding protein [Brotocaccenecus cirricatena]MCC2128779.1 ABC transporter ATP-binding protein [Brotocaccenecus cirricatena]
MERVENSAAALSVGKLSFSYKTKKTVLKNISFTVPLGDVLTILGPNGSGKTTLLNCILRNISGYSGEIQVLGKLLQNYTTKEYAAAVAYVPQLSQLNFDYTVEEFTLMGCNPHKSFLAQPTEEDYALVAQSLRQLGIYELKDSLMGEISGGERQLVYIARAITQQPKLIIMDEPTSALDYSNQYKVIQMLKSLNQNGYSIILTSHNPEYAYMLGGHVAMLYKGEKFLHGKVSELMTEENLTEMYGTEIKVRYLPEFDTNICIRTD